MKAKVHFLGLEVAPREVRVTLMRRDGEVAAVGRYELEPSGEKGSWYTFTPNRWAREIGSAARETLEESGVPASRIWGYAPAAPCGWVCLDVEWNPITELHVAKEDFADPRGEDLLGLLETEERLRARVALVAAPKDFLRFRWSKLIATDASDAAGFGLLGRDESEWDGELIRRHDVDASWLPPVLPSAFACGRVGPEGMEATGLDSSAWAAVGSTNLPARLAACGMPRKEAVYVFAHDPHHAYWYRPARADGSPTGRAPGSTAVARAPLAEIPSEIFAEDTPIVLDWLEGEDPQAIIGWAESTGRPVFTAPFAGAVSPGPAVMAALASGAYASREAFYRRFPHPRPLGEATSSER